MSMLEGFPFVDQRTTATTDGLPSENSLDDCVAASICAAVMYLKGISRVGGIYTPDNFKDKADGQGYVGFTAAIQYVNFCQSLGVKLYAVEAGDYSSLIQKAHEFLAEGKPVIFTQDDWVVDTSLDKYQGWTHVAAWYADEPGTLTSMDPWGGFPRMKSDAGWVAVMRGKGEIWIAERITVSTLDTLKEHGWHDDGTTLTAPNGVPVIKGFRDFVLAQNWDAQNIPLAPEYGTPQLEGSNPSLGGGTQQVFRWKMLGWTQAHGVFEEWTGQELLYLSKKVADYYKKVQDLQKQLAAVVPPGVTDPLATQALAVVQQIKPLFQPF
jgi:hypothetical protein